MKGFFTSIKMNFKLLLRNKGYLCFLIILPVLSVIMLNINNNVTVNGGEDIYKIHELDKDDDLVLDVVNAKISLKVYDCSNSDFSDYVLEELAKTGSYQIYRYQSDAMELKEVRKKALYSANHNTIKAVIYIPASFENELLKNGKGNLLLFEADQDSRIELLKINLNTYLDSLASYAKIAGYQKEALNELLKFSVDNEISKEIKNVEVGDSLNLTRQQQSKSTSIGYSLSFLTISFLFSGIFIASNVVEERQNRVYNRILLSEASLSNYALVKLAMILFTVLLQTGIIAIAIKLMVKTDFGIPFSSYLFLVSGLGLILNMFSVAIGMLTNNVMTSNYIAFLVWTLSSLLAGLYFPLDGASKWWDRVAMLMPQHWVVKSSEMLMAEKRGVYPMYVLVVAGYLIVILCIGLMGIRLRRKE
jgi:ABC-2 type transport system permease protein